MEHVGDIIKRLRKRNNDTLKDLGKKVNFNFSNLSKIERGLRKPTFELLEDISKIYDVPMSTFFDDREVPEELDEFDIEWKTLKQEAKDNGYTPEELREIAEFLIKLRKKKWLESYKIIQCNV